jgi:hypothetical protein
MARRMSILRIRVSDEKSDFVYEARTNGHIEIDDAYIVKGSLYVIREFAGKTWNPVVDYLHKILSSYGFQACPTTTPTMFGTPLFSWDCSEIRIVVILPPPTQNPERLEDLVADFRLTGWVPIDTRCMAITLWLNEEEEQYEVVGPSNKSAALPTDPEPDHHLCDDAGPGD